MYCIKLRRTEEEFWDARISKILKMIDMYADEKEMQASMVNNTYYNSRYFNKEEEVETITSMSQIRG